MLVQPARTRRERDFPGILAATLNGQYPRNSLGRLAGIPYDRPSLHVQGFCNPSRETRDAAVTEFLSELRRLTDQWIASGREQIKSIGEQPWSRNVLWFSDAYQEPIDRTLQKFLDRNPPPILPYSDGRLTIASHLWLPLPTVWPFPEPKLEDTLARARDLAIYEFQQFLGSDFPQRLFRCDECEKYFVLARNPRKVIQRGAYCKNCKSAGGKRRVEDQRKDERNEMLKVAAKAWGEWTRRTRIDQKGWVVQAVREQCEVVIQRKWVSRRA